MWAIPTNILLGPLSPCGRRDGLRAEANNGKLATSGCLKLDASLFEIVQSSAMIDNDRTQAHGASNEAPRPSKTTVALTPAACQAQQHHEQVDEVEV
jgi:hypothetical protein